MQILIHALNFGRKMRSSTTRHVYLLSIALLEFSRLRWLRWNAVFHWYDFSLCRKGSQCYWYNQNTNLKVLLN
jgi:hypothetical protein